MWNCCCGPSIRDQVQGGGKRSNINMAPSTSPPDSSSPRPATAATAGGKPSANNTAATNNNNTNNTNNNNNNNNNNSNNNNNNNNTSTNNTNTNNGSSISSGGRPSRAPPLTEAPNYLLKPRSSGDNRKCLVLDLDETLIHSSFKPINDADFRMEIDLDGTHYKVWVRKRPGVEEFLKGVALKYEVVIFTASLAKYADPLLDILDPENTCTYRLFRESCVQHEGNYVKDLRLLGRPIENSIIVDNSPYSYQFQPENAVPILSWFNDRQDRQLYELLPFLEELADSNIDDVRTVIRVKDWSFLNGPPLSPLGSESENNNNTNNVIKQQMLQMRKTSSPPSPSASASASPSPSSTANPLVWSVAPPPGSED